MKTFREYLQELSLILQRNEYKVKIEFTIEKNGMSKRSSVEIKIAAPDEEAAAEQAGSFIQDKLTQYSRKNTGGTATGKVVKIKQVK